MANWRLSLLANAILTHNQTVNQKIKRTVTLSKSSYAAEKNELPLILNHQGMAKTTFDYNCMARAQELWYPIFLTLLTRTLCMKVSWEQQEEQIRRKGY